MQRLANVHPSDLTKFPSGNGKIQLNASNEGSKILMYNETPLNIDLDFLNGKSDVLHAWEANFWTLDGDTKEVDWNIDVDSLNVSNPPINAIFLTLYDPIEKLNDKAYPMPLIRQIGGQVAVTGPSSGVSNEGGATNTEVIDIGTINISKLIDIFTDHFVWSVQQSGIAHQVLKGQTAGNPLQIGQALDTTEVLGSLVVDESLKTNTIRDNTSGADLIDLAATLITLNKTLAFSTVNTQAGSVAGSIQYSFPIWGAGFKLGLFAFVGYNDATNHTILLPSATSRMILLDAKTAGGVNTWQNGATGVSINNITTLGGTAGGADTSSPTDHSDTYGYFTAALDRVVTATTGGAVTNGLLILIGL